MSWFADDVIVPVIVSRFHRVLHKGLAYTWTYVVVENDY